jgi:toxin ParE1/3/4
MKYGFSEDAIADLDEVCDSLGRYSVKAAGALFDRIRQRAKLVASFPKTGKSYGDLVPGLRGFVVDNYIVFYIPTEEGIEILRVVNGYRDLKSIFEFE